MAIGCRKGNRQCDFPPPASGSSKKPKHADSRPGQKRPSEEKDTAETSGLETIKDESEDDAAPDELTQPRPRLEKLRTNSAQSLPHKQKWRQHSEVSAASSTTASSATKEKETTPSTETSSSHSRSNTPSSVPTNAPPHTTTTSRQARWADRRADIQKYLKFHDEHITYYHYFLKFDMEDFIHTELIDLALTYEPLLWAVVTFAAYFYTIQQPDGQLNTFLTYYSKSLSLLMKALAKNAKPTEATLLTVLQLATFEEFLGDWVNLVGHHRAAHYMLLDLYTSENIMDTEVTRQILAWYARFDVVAGLMAGNETVLDRKWYLACSAYFDERIDTEDVDVDYSLQYIIAQNRLVGMDIAALFSRLAKGAIDMNTFVTENASVSQRLQGLKSRVEALNDGYYTVTEFPYRVPLTSADIVNPYVPGGLFRGAFWPLNYAWCDWYGIYQMHEYQTSLALGQSIPAEFEQLSLEQCRIFEAIERYPDAPPGSGVAAHTSLALASVFLKKDERHIMWARRKLASVERMGYIFPPAFRQKMSEMWQLPEVEHWWLPNEEGYAPILREIRKLIEERVKKAKEGRSLAAGGQADDLRDIKAIFSRMNIGGSGSGEESSPGSATSVTALTPPSSGSTVIAGETASKAAVVGMLPGLWPKTESSSSGTGISTGVVPAPVQQEQSQVQRRRQSLGSNVQRKQSQVDRMSWVGDS
jgi:hypothetical protein